MMNDKAQQLNLKNTHFKNATGLHDNDHYTCAHDLALMALYLIEIGGDDLLSVTSLYDSYIRENTKQSFWLVNTNKLLKLYDGVDGLKTGYTKEAGYCLVTTSKRDNQRIIGVLMKESAPKTRNEEMCNLLDYGFNNFKQEIIFKKDNIIEKYVIDKMDNLTIDVKCKQDIAFQTKVKNSDSKYSTKITIKIIFYLLNPHFRSTFASIAANGSMALYSSSTVLVCAPISASMACGMRSMLYRLRTLCISSRIMPP